MHHIPAYHGAVVRLPGRPPSQCGAFAHDDSDTAARNKNPAPNSRYGSLFLSLIFCSRFTTRLPSHPGAPTVYFDFLSNWHNDQPVSAVPMLRHDPFQAHLASLLEQARDDLAGLMVVVNDTIRGSFQELA
jgi:hypothetical protein